MIKKVVVFLSISLTLASCSVIPAVKVLQGPGTKTIVLGPDGAVVYSRFPGGTLVTDADAPAGVLAAGPALLPSSQAVIVGDGPVGKVITSYTLGGPAVVPGVFADEGQYAGEDYDDGSWKGH